MRFDPPLVPGILLRRYKRFLADVEFADGSVVTAHCANPGSMLSVCTPGSEVWLAPATAPGRTLAFGWELIRVGAALVGINTARTNALVAEALSERRVAELDGYAEVRREVRYGVNSRIDFRLGSADRPAALVEVKNVTMRRDLRDGAPFEFPDSVTVRGTKHLRELAAAATQGARAVMLFVAQRSDAAALAFAADIDPAYTRAAIDAVAAGVEMLCYSCVVDSSAVRIDRRVPVMLPASLQAA